MSEHCYHPYEHGARILKINRKVPKDLGRCCWCETIRFTDPYRGFVGPKGHGMYHPEAYPVGKLLYMRNLYDVQSVLEKEPECKDNS